jgi:hypothetical protein
MSRSAADGLTFDTCPFRKSYPHNQSHGRPGAGRSPLGQRAGRRASAGVRETNLGASRKAIGPIYPITLVVVYAANGREAPRAARVPLSGVREMTYLYRRAASGTPKSLARESTPIVSYSAASNLADLLYLRGVDVMRTCDCAFEL